jgi:hypothetical protein
VMMAVMMAVAVVVGEESDGTPGRPVVRQIH